MCKYTVMITIIASLAIGCGDNGTQSFEADDFVVMAWDVSEDTSMGSEDVIQEDASRRDLAVDMTDDAWTMVDISLDVFAEDLAIEDVEQDIFQQGIDEGEAEDLADLRGLDQQEAADTQGIDMVVGVEDVEQAQEDLPASDLAAQDDLARDDVLQVDLAQTDFLAIIEDTTIPPDVCIPRCRGIECGPDGCGGECPPGCGTGNICEAGQCVPCEPSCWGIECGLDPVCGTRNCGNCQPLADCTPEGQCVCQGAACGSACCPEGQVCDATEHCCTPDCDGKECGADGCGGYCGPGCEVGYTCNPDGLCISEELNVCAYWIESFCGCQTSMSRQRCLDMWFDELRGCDATPGACESLCCNKCVDVELVCGWQQDCAGMPWECGE